jgi:hypothetical protein
MSQLTTQENNLSIQGIINLSGKYYAMGIVNRAEKVHGKASKQK